MSTQTTTLDLETFCDECGDVYERRHVTTHRIYDPNERLVDTCKECYKKLLRENKHIHPDNRL